jgi:hypothetical protein
MNRDDRPLACFHQGEYEQEWRPRAYLDKATCLYVLIGLAVVVATVAVML